ncbi:DinB family protein [Kribbella sp. NPDC023855]|uniref:DinB family protein n=1 Tax=Kribbella sp. NPDC023855 TaxID=3154698 RepID=UPI0033D79E81
MDLNGRPDPPTEAGEKETLVGFLEFQRATLRWKCEGLTAQQLGSAVVAPSSMTLHGLIRHLTENELGWFVGTFTDELVPVLYSSPTNPEGDWTDLEPGQFSADLRRYDEAVGRARAVIAGLEPDHVGEDEGRRYTLRWVLAHMIEEYARHNGHADFLRERLDGATGE